MFKIGDFSKISQVSVKTLRYYDEIGLLKPVQIDHSTGYRYYSFEQLRQLHRILALKDLGLSLEQIVQLLNEDVSANTIRGMLMIKQNAIQQLLQEEQERLRRVQVRLKQIEQEGKMSDYDVVLKKVEPMIVASAREIVGSLRDVGSRIQALIAEVRAAMATTGLKTTDSWFATYYMTEYRTHNIDVEVAIRLEKASQEERPRSGAVSIRELPGIDSVASVVHNAGFDRVFQAYRALGQWADNHGYCISGDSREIYLNFGEDGSTPVVEVQFPVEKA
jgi:DNA-binding transcriptional MerR regulator